MKMGNERNMTKSVYMKDVKGKRRKERQGKMEGQIQPCVAKGSTNIVESRQIRETIQKFKKESARYTQLYSGVTPC